MAARKQSKKSQKGWAKDKILFLRLFLHDPVPSIRLYLPHFYYFSIILKITNSSMDEPIDGVMSPHDPTTS